MKVLITGGSGFVGQHAIRRLLAEGHRVVAPARREEACIQLRSLGASSMRLDYGDRPALSRAMEGCEAVVHVAAHLKMWGPWQAFEASNVTLTDQVLQSAKEGGAKRFVHISAASVIMKDPVPIIGADESWPLTSHRQLPYSATKAIAEQRVLAAHGEHFKTIALRPPFIWGPGDAVDADLGAQVRKGQFAWINQGQYRYATCQVQNLCHAIALALPSEATGAFFITDGPEITLREFLTQRLQASGLSSPRLSVPATVAWASGRAMEAMWATGWLAGDPPLTRETVRLIGYPFSLNTRQARALLGYTPSIDLSEGLRQCSRS